MTITYPTITKLRSKCSVKISTHQNTNNPSMDGEDLLDHIDSVDTTQLLDLLERETHQSGPLSRCTASGARITKTAENTATNGADDFIAIDSDDRCNGRSRRKQQQQTPASQGHRRNNRSGYTSADSHDSAFTSTLLGGRALLEHLDETAVALNKDASASYSDSLVDYPCDITSTIKQSSYLQGGAAAVATTATASVNYNSDSTSTTKGANGNNKYAKLAVDNPFGKRPGANLLSVSSGGHETKSNNIINSSNSSSLSNNHAQNNKTSFAGQSSTTTSAAVALSPANKCNNDSSGDLIFITPNATMEATITTSDDSGNDDRRNKSSRHSVSFSIDEPDDDNNRRNNLNDDNNDNYDDNEEGKEDDDTNDDHPRNSKDDNQRCNNASFDTFLPGSLGSLAISSAQRPSVGGSSNRSRSSYTTRSSRSSRSSHGSATTASTHSSKSSQERRQRRELLPAVTIRTNDSNKKSKKSSKVSSSRSSTSVGGGGVVATSGGSVLSSSSSTRSGGSSSLYRRNSKHKNKGKLYANLHLDHPTRYPQRSSIIKEELNEDDYDDDYCGGGGGGTGMYYDSDLNSSNEDLFAQTKKGKKAKEDEESGDFLDGLIASTTKKKKKTLTSLDKDDNASVGDTSFLSDLLNGHLNNNQGGDGRGGGAKKRKGGSIISGMSSLGIASASNNRTDDCKDKSKKDDRLHDDDDWYNITVIRKLELFRDEGMACVRRVIQRAENWYEHGDRLPRTRQECIQWYEEGGALFPRSKKEWVQWGVLALVLSPFLHLAVHYIIDGGSSSNDYYGGEIQFVNNNGVVGNAKAHLAGKNGGGQSSLYSLGETSKAWAGSSMVMLSRRSSLRENFILIPDADWIELQISRNRASTNSDGRTSFFSRKRSSSDSQKPPQRLPLPSLLDPIYNATASMVLFSLTASNGNNVPTSKASDLSKLNANANSNLWNAITSRLVPEPVDAFPSWSHNSLAQFREDSFTLMFPYGARNEARSALSKLAIEFGQSAFYEFTTWSETPTGSDYGFSGGNIRRDGAKGALERAGSIRRIGKDGSAIIIPPLPEGRSDVMIRKTIVVNEKALETVGEDPMVVMRRVKDLPVEDELTMREFEGPSVETIRWSKKKARLTNKKSIE